MRARTYVPLLLVSAAATVMLAHANSPTEKVANTDQFLQPGDSYVIQFLRGRTPHYTSGQDPSPLDFVDDGLEPRFLDLIPDYLSCHKTARTVLGTC